jgi:hypothetical protein
MMPEYKHYLSKLSIDGIQRHLEVVKQVDLKTAQIDDLKLQLSDLLWAYGCFAVSINGERSIFRARRHLSEEKEQVLDRVEEVYPSAQYIKTLGRVNREGTPVFYFSADPVIALHECKAIPGDVFTILECKPRSRTEPILMPIGIHDLLRKHDKKIGGDFPEPAVRIRQVFENDEINLRKYELIDTFVVNEFLKVINRGNEHEFKLTIAIAEFLFAFETDIGPVDGIAYPSIASEWYNANVAFLPDAFHRLYKPVGSLWLRIDGIKPNLGFSVSKRVSKEVTEEGKIQW